MTKARPSSLLRALAAVLLAAFAASGGGVLAFDGAAGAGSTISNRAEATYTDPEGTGYATVSPTITLTVLTSKPSWSADKSRVDCPEHFLIHGDPL